jgi:hypothetical protein
VSLEFCSSSTFVALVMGALSLYFSGLAVTCFFGGER